MVSSIFSELVDDGAHLGWSLLAVPDVGVRLLAEVDVGVKALEECQGRNRIDRHKDACHHIRQAEDKQQWWQRVLSSTLDSFNLSDHRVGDEKVADCNRKFTQKLNKCTNTIRDNERAAILQSQHKCCHSRRTEVLASKCHLDIGILVQEFHESMTAVEAASDGAGGAFCN